MTLALLKCYSINDLENARLALARASKGCGFYTFLPKPATSGDRESSQKTEILKWPAIARPTQCYCYVSLAIFEIKNLLTARLVLVVRIIF